MSSGYIINLDTDVFDKLNKAPIIANNYPLDTIEDKENFDNLLLTRYEDSNLKPAPQCSCGKLKGVFRVGEVCSACGETVTNNFQEEIKSDVWLVPLPGISSFITPISWRILQHHMLEDRFDCLKYLTSAFYKPELPTIVPPRRLEYVMEQGHIRGLNYFINNFDKVMRDFCYGAGRKKYEKIINLEKYIEMNRNNIFCTVLPVPSRVMFPIERVGSKTSYGDKNMIPVIDAVRIMQEAESRRDSLDLKRMEARMVKCMDLFAEFHFNYVKNVLGSKYGVFRQHTFGGRMQFSARAVITSLYEPHDFREVHYPWSFGIGKYGIHVVNKLIKRGYTLFEIYDKLRKASKNYNAEINEIFEEIIEESPYIGLPIILQRNPTIRRASALRLYVTKIKPNPEDKTISMSVGNLKGFNADFDGDELNTIALLDSVMHDAFESLAPENNVMDMSTPWKISSNLGLHTPAVSTAVNWIRHGFDAAYGENQTKR